MIRTGILALPITVILCAVGCGNGARTAQEPSDQSRAESPVAQSQNAAANSAAKPAAKSPGALFSAF